MQKEICRFLASRPDFAGVRATSKPKKSNRGGPKHANEHTFRKGTTVHRPSGAENRLNKQCKEMLATCFESVCVEKLLAKLVAGRRRLPALSVQTCLHARIKSLDNPRLAASAVQLRVIFCLPVPKWHR